jgi:hypothetical protein
VTKVSSPNGFPAGNLTATRTEPTWTTFTDEVSMTPSSSTDATRTLRDDHGAADGEILPGRPEAVGPGLQQPEHDHAEVAGPRFDVGEGRGDQVKHRLRPHRSVSLLPRIISAAIVSVNSAAARVRCGLCLPFKPYPVPAVAACYHPLQGDSGRSPDLALLVR